MTRKNPNRSVSAAAPVSVPRDFLAEEAGDTACGQGFPLVALAWPNTYASGMSSLGYHLIRQTLRECGCRVERLFHEKGRAATLESSRRLSGFDLLAFSISFELDYPNVLALLDAARIPLLASRRPIEAPLVIAGGVAVAVNRHPIYPFVDILVHGEGEDVIAPLLDACRECAGFRRKIGERARLYQRLREIPGVEVTAGAMRAAGMEAAGLEVAGLAPEVAEELEAVQARIESRPASSRIGRFAGQPVGRIGRIRQIGPSPTSHFFNPQSAIHGEAIADYPQSFVPPALTADLNAVKAVSRVVTPRAELGRRVLVEIARGCPHFCAYCWVGHNTRKFAPRPAANVLALLDEAREITRCDSAGLISSAVGAHPEIDAICEGLLSRGMQVSYSSLRAEETTPLMLEALVRSGQRGLTLAPEAGDEPLRRTIGKSLNDAGFLQAIERSQRAGLSDLKLYFMTGLPGETEEAADAIVSFTDAARRILLGFGRERGHLGELSVNLGIYVPKPNTPLARRETPPLTVVRKRVARLTRALSALPNVRVASEGADLSAAQRLLSCGGLESALLLHEIWRSGGDWRPVIRRAAREKGL